MLLLTLILACGDKSEDSAVEETVDTAAVEDTSSEDTAEAQ